MYIYQASSIDDFLNFTNKKITIKILSDTNEYFVGGYKQKIGLILELIKADCKLTIYKHDNSVGIPIDKFSIPYWFYELDNFNINDLEFTFDLIPKSKYNFIKEQFSILNFESNQDVNLEFEFKLSIEKPDAYLKNKLGDYQINIE